MEFSFELGNLNIVQKAHVYAMAAHSAVGQKRKYTNEPYIVHPAAVAQLVSTVPNATEDMVAAAYLHDVIEDTGCTFTDIHMAFGIDIAGMVDWLTDKSTASDGNRATRKAIDRARIAMAPPEVHTIKLCDVISNCTSIKEHDPKFAVTYFEEKRLLLEVLTKGDPVMYQRAKDLVL